MWLHVTLSSSLIWFTLTFTLTIPHPQCIVPHADTITASCHHLYFPDWVLNSLRPFVTWLIDVCCDLPDPLRISSTCLSRACFGRYPVVTQTCYTYGPTNGDSCFSVCSPTWTVPFFFWLGYLFSPRLTEDTSVSLWSYEVWCFQFLHLVHLVAKLDLTNSILITQSSKLVLELQLTQATFVAIFSFVERVFVALGASSGRQTIADDSWRRTNHAIRNHNSTDVSV